MKQPIEIEKVVLGSMLMDKATLYQAMSAVDAEDFTDWRHKEIYAAIKYLFDRDIAVDLLTVNERLTTVYKADFSVVYLSELSNNIGTTAHIEDHCRILNQHKIGRQTVLIALQAQKSIESGEDPIDTANVAQRGLFEVLGVMTRNSTKTLQELSIEFYRWITNKEQKPTGLKTGFDKYDNLTGGSHASDVVVIAARPGVGKTSFVLTLAYNHAKAGIPVLIASLEMPADQLIKKLVSIDSGVPLRAIRHNSLTPSDRELAIKSSANIQKLPIHINDTGGMDLAQLKSLAYRFKNDTKAEHFIFVIDYLQLMAMEYRKGQTRDQEIGVVTRALKSLAKELNCTIYELSQLNRDVEKRAGIPRLSDLRESGNIEQDADIVIFINRPDYEKNNPNMDAPPQDGIVILNIAKHRNGALGNIELWFDANTTKFSDIAPINHQLHDYTVPISEQDAPF